MTQAPAPVEFVELAPGYRIPRIIRGGWQLAGDHGPVDRARALGDMQAFVATGLNTVDGADIYTGVEDMYGEFNQQRKAQGRPPMQVHTKFVPDYSDLASVDAAYVRRVIARSCKRLRTQRLDLVQFHWWDYVIPGAIETAKELARLREQGLIAHLGCTNFDSVHLAAMLDAGVPMVSIQIQYSLLDRRAANALARVCCDRGVQMLCYGTLAGGFFSEQWLGAPEPVAGLSSLSPGRPTNDCTSSGGQAKPGLAALTNRSLIKYKLVIDEFGGWPAFQNLLRALKTIGERHGVGIASVATRWVLDQAGVGAAIVGARYAERLGETLAVFGLRLDAQDHALLEPILSAHPGPTGDTYALERDRSGVHGRIMKYELNKS